MRSYVSFHLKRSRKPMVRFPRDKGSGSFVSCPSPPPPRKEAHPLPDWHNPIQPLVKPRQVGKVGRTGTKPGVEKGKMPAFSQSPNFWEEENTVVFCFG